MDKVSFNLVREAWIPCVQVSGKLEKLSILDLLLHSSQLDAIAHPSPLVAVSVLRLLLAILHRVFGPKSVEEWEVLWRRPSLPEQPIRDYLYKWEHRFDLLDQDRPFYQDPTLRSSSSLVTINRLFHQNASGNNGTLFDHSLDDSNAEVQFDEAALQLLAAQTFAVGGLVTPDPSVPKGSKSAEGSPAVKAILFSVSGENLRETLLLNLAAYDPLNGIPFGEVKDCPAWEKSACCSLTTRTPYGMTDLLTWQARRVLLLPSGLREHRIRQSLLMKGEQISESFAAQERDAMIAWKVVNRGKNQQAWQELSFQPDRGVWRDAHSLYATNVGKVIRPPILDWLAKLIEDVLDPSMTFALDACGLSTDRAKIRSWHLERLPLPGKILRDPRLTAQILKSQETADRTAVVLGSTTQTLAKALIHPLDPEKLDKDSNKKAISSLALALSRREQFWSDMEVAFHRLVHRLVAEGTNSISDETEISPALEQWFAECKKAAVASMEKTLSAAGRSARAYQAVALADIRFRRGLRKVIPLHANGALAL